MQLCFLFLFFLFFILKNCATLVGDLAVLQHQGLQLGVFQSSHLLITILEGSHDDEDDEEGEEGDDEEDSDDEKE